MNRWFYLPLFGAFALSMTLASPSPASAQPRWGYDNGSVSYAYDNGYRAGAREGERDARDGKQPGFKRDNAYEDADWGFRGGDKGRYKYEFRRGYEAGYDTAYHRSARGGWYDNRGWNDTRPGVEVIVPGPSYPAYGDGYNVGRVAYDNGYRDGLEEGHRDVHRDRPYGLWRCDRFRDGDHGYNGRFGSRDAYRTDYRSGFRAGYDAGYGNQHDW
jgi:hypothetical protein